MKRKDGKMDNYVLRIYRRDLDNPEATVGMLHEVATEVKRPFHGLAELYEMLCLPGTICRRKKRKKVAQCRRGKGANVE